MEPEDCVEPGICDLRWYITCCMIIHAVDGIILRSVVDTAICDLLLIHAVDTAICCILCVISALRCGQFDFLLLGLHSSAK